MAYEIPITAPGLDQLNKSIDDSVKRVRALREEAGRTRSDDHSSYRTHRQQLRDDGEAHRQRIRNKRLEEQEEDRQRRKRNAEADREERRRAKLSPKITDPEAELRRLVYSTRLNLGVVSPLVGDLRRTGILPDGAEEAILKRIRAGFSGAGKWGSRAAAAGAAGAPARGAAGAAGAGSEIVRYGAPIARWGGAGFSGSVALSSGASVMAMLKAGLLAGIGVSVATAGARAAYALANNASEITNDRARSYYRGGGRPGAAIGIGAFVGMSAGQTADAANGLGDRLRGGGYGASYLRSRGVVDFGSTTVNKFENLTKAIDALRKETNETTAMRVARDVGLSDFLSVRDLSESSYQGLKNAYQASSTPAARRSAAEYEAAKTRVSLGWERIVQAAGLPIADAGADYFSGITGNAGSAWKVLRRGLKNQPMTGIPLDIADQIQNFFESRRGGGGSKPDENTQAVKELTRTIKEQGEIVGGGARARGAMPIGVKAMMMDEALRHQASYNGAFTIG